MNETTIVEELEAKLKQARTNCGLQEDTLPQTNKYGSTLETLHSREPSPADLLNKKMVKETLTQMLSQIPARERAVLDYRFGITDGQPLSLTEIGRRFSVCGARIRQIESKAMRRLSGCAWLKFGFRNREIMMEIENNYSN